MALAYNLLNSAGILLPEPKVTARTSFTGTSAAETLYGTSGADYFSLSGGGADVAIGGAGDDIYIIGGGDSVIERAFEGIDSVTSYATDYTLGANIENLIVGTDKAYGGGNSLDNIVKGGSGAQSLDGAAGDDVLIGGDGVDTFIIRSGNGSDVIADFNVGGREVVRLDDYDLHSFADVQSHLRQAGADTVLALSATESLILRATQADSLTAANFLLPADLSGLKMTFDDEFDTFSRYDAATGTGTWRNVFGYGGGQGISNRSLTSGGEQQIYMDPEFAGTGTTPLGVNPFSLSNGQLTITATEASEAVSAKIWDYKYTSGLITSKMSFSQLYGYFEVRADLPDTAGVWPAFWLLNSNGVWPPEIDVFEGLGDDNVVHTTAHTKETGTHISDGSTVHVNDTADGFNTYGILWTSDTLTWYIDGAAVKQIATPSDMHSPMYVLANMAVGGWAGAPAPGLNAEMKIDYIRAYSLEGLDAPAVTGKTFVDTAGNDTFAITSAADIFTGPGGGTDTAKAGLSYTLKTGIENLVLTGASALLGTGNAGSNRLTGNDGVSTLMGLDGNDTLVAGKGVTTMHGGNGNDAYTVYHDGDVIRELSGEGTDSVQSGVSYTLSDNIESLKLTGNGVLVATSNALDNRIAGNGGASSLFGLDGNDVLMAGTGIATLNGGAGNDLYQVTHTGDIVVESANEGTDTVSASVSFALGANVEKLTLTGTAAITGTGNSLDNVLTGNGGNNDLSGGAGADTINGAAGNDTITGGTGKDSLTGGAGSDTFVLTGADNDKITDFNAVDDRFALSSLAFSALTDQNADDHILLTSQFATGAAAATAEQHVIYNASTGALYYDADGNGSGAMVQIATLSKGLALTHNDFVVW